jgi:hypothetical protein
MATITSITRSAPMVVFDYPADYPGWGIHGCRGCLGLGGDCTAAIKSTKVLIAFTLSDGRSGTVALSTSATRLDSTNAISAWATANPLIPPDPSIGTVV